MLNRIKLLFACGVWLLAAGCINPEYANPGLSSAGQTHANSSVIDSAQVRRLWLSLSDKALLSSRTLGKTTDNALKRIGQIPWHHYAKSGEQQLHHYAKSGEQQLHTTWNFVGRTAYLSRQRIKSSAGELHTAWNTLGHAAYRSRQSIKAKALESWNASIYPQLNHYSTQAFEQSKQIYSSLLSSSVVASPQRLDLDTPGEFEHLRLEIVASANPVPSQAKSKFQLNKEICALAGRSKQKFRDREGKLQKCEEAIHLAAFVDLSDPDIIRELRWFTQNPEGKKVFGHWLSRAPKYLNTIEAGLRDASLPEGLPALAFVESGLQQTAKSGVGAAGLWQFMPATGKEYGLEVEEGHDERLSLSKATQAATKHLQFLDRKFGRWDIALAAYNAGSGALRSFTSKCKGCSFRELREKVSQVPNETRIFVPRVFAIAILLDNLELFELSMPSVRLASGAEIIVPGGTALSVLADAADCDLSEIRKLNPQIVGDCLPRTRSQYQVVVPARRRERAIALLPVLSEKAIVGERRRATEVQRMAKHEEFEQALALKQEEAPKERSAPRRREVSASKYARFSAERYQAVGNTRSEEQSN